ncbi:response regulator [Paenibacillus sp.]|jgi:two-component system response regulator YesN|uniref:response regulator transcription factor n=1 Tax=Paenibacillus sp. TaxID=58172 RepID=UPI002824352A|nr:response regulator [Paenibacillus sp.]MDR0267201.1 response regulator [Paenibacillus sp.]
MHKVMLIDDDVPMLKVLQQMIEWEALQLNIVGTTYSSAKALHLFKETWPDIVITDIGLPQKNGIELAADFRSMKPDIRVIFLTCHEDFHYAQQAVKLNADDYLLKDQLTPDQLEQSLNKTIRFLQKKSAPMGQKASHYNKELFKQGLIQRVIDGGHPESTVDYAAGIGISWGYPWFMLGVVNLHYSSYERFYVQNNLSLIMYAIYNIAVELSEAYEGITPFLDQDNLIVLYNYRLNLADNVCPNFQRYMEELRSRAAQFLKLQLNIVTVTDKMGLADVGGCYHQIIHHKNGFYEGNELTVKDMQLYMQQVFLPFPQGSLDTYKTDMERAILKNDAHSIHDMVVSIGDKVKEKRFEPDEIVQEVILLLRSVAMMFSGRKWDETRYTYLSYARTLEDVMELAERQLVFIAQNKQGSTVSAAQEPKLQQIQQFIDQHLADNVTSIDMARYLYLNPSYFSRYFKRLTGVNFTDYVHQYKMTIATKMMKTSGQTLESLAMGLGYSDRTYFSKVFKKYIGMTPSEYKTKYAVNKYAR